MFFLLSTFQVGTMRCGHRQPMNRRSRLSDQTNSPLTPTSGSRSSFFVPPPLFSQIERSRSRRSEGEVSRTRVVCRSAPGSRKGSVTCSGGTYNDDHKERSRMRDNTREDVYQVLREHKFYSKQARGTSARLRA